MLSVWEEILRTPSPLSRSTNFLTQVSLIQVMTYSLVPISGPKQSTDAPMKPFLINSKTQVLPHCVNATITFIAGRMAHGHRHAHAHGHAPRVICAGHTAHACEGQAPRRAPHARAKPRPSMLSPCAAVMTASEKANGTAPELVLAECRQPKCSAHPPRRPPRGAAPPPPGYAHQYEAESTTYTMALTADHLVGSGNAFVKMSAICSLVLTYLAVILGSAITWCKKSRSTRCVLPTCFMRGCRLFKSSLRTASLSSQIFNLAKRVGVGSDGGM